MAACLRAHGLNVPDPGAGGQGGGPGGPGGPGGGRGAQASIQSWVSAHFRSQTLGGVTVYDLSQPKS
jgi:hypothetical protein